MFHDIATKVDANGSLQKVFEAFEIVIGKEEKQRDNQKTVSTTPTRSESPRHLKFADVTVKETPELPVTSASPRAHQPGASFNRTRSYSGDESDYSDVENNDEMLKPKSFSKELMEGIKVIKHGRRGKPHGRIIFCDASGTRLFWQNIGDTLKTNVDRSIVMPRISNVLSGQKTEVFQRSGTPQDANKYVSLIAGDRTLDIEAESAEEAQRWISGFKELVGL